MQNIQEPKAMWNDIIRFITVAVIVHLLFYTVDDYGKFFNESVLKILLYSTIGFIIYHLIITKLVDKYLFRHVNNTTIPNVSNFTNLKQKEESKKPIKSILRKSTSKKKNKKVSFKE